MPSIRKAKTKSGATAVQVVRYENRKVAVLKHIGSAHTKLEAKALIQAAEVWIQEYSQQPHLGLPSPRSDRVLHLDHVRFKGVRYSFAYTILTAMIERCGFGSLGSELLRDLVLMRIFEPCSKRQSLVLLERYFARAYTETVLYHALPKMIAHKAEAERLAVSFAKTELKSDLAFVLYDVTTLYFESFEEDDLRKNGFSKDNKANQPQIVIGLLVNTDGFPLDYEVFKGNTFEGHTMLPIIQAFQKTHDIKTLTVVADAAMLSEDNMEKLKKQSLSYIVGGRAANLSPALITQISTVLSHEDGKTFRLPTKHGDLICEFSAKRYRKDLREMNKQRALAEDLVKKNEPGRRAKFVTIDKAKEKYALNQALIDKTTELLGIKGYYTNIPETTMTDKDAIKRYHDLWRVEQSFRMAKSDLVARPIFHHKADSVKAHMLICFIALSVGKYMELKTGLSLKKIVEHLSTVTDACLVDTVTGETVTLRSELSLETESLAKQLGVSY